MDFITFVLYGYILVTPLSKDDIYQLNLNNVDSDKKDPMDDHSA